MGLDGKATKIEESPATPPILILACHIHAHTLRRGQSLSQCIHRQQPGADEEQQEQQEHQVKERMNEREGKGREGKKGISDEKGAKGRDEGSE